MAKAELALLDVRSVADIQERGEFIGRLNPEQIKQVNTFVKNRKQKLLTEQSLA